MESKSLPEATMPNRHGFAAHRIEVLGSLNMARC